MILFVILFFFSGFTFRSMTHFFELIFVYGARCDQLLLRFYLHRGIHVFWASQETQVAKNPPANAGDGGLIPGSGRSPGGGHGSPLQYPCLENSMHRRAWRATVHRVAESRTWLSVHSWMDSWAVSTLRLLWIELFWGPVVKTPCFYCRGMAAIPGWGTDPSCHKVQRLPPPKSTGLFHTNAKWNVIF